MNRSPGSAHKPAGGGSLRGLRVLITRPQQQQGPLRKAIEARGGETLSLPLLEIAPLSDEVAVRRIRERLREADCFHLMIFVSSNAARFGARWINERWPRLPASMGMVAIGPATARTVVSELACPVIHAESGMTSEDALALPVLQEVAGRHVAIVCGAGGRELLGETLQRRGARVSRVEVYERRPAMCEPAQFRQLLTRHRINVLTVSSGESMERLASLLSDAAADAEEQRRLSLLPLIVPSARVARRAGHWNPGTVKNANGADDQSFLVALEELAVTRAPTAGTEPEEPTGG